MRRRLLRMNNHNNRWHRSPAPLFRLDQTHPPPNRQGPSQPDFARHHFAQQQAPWWPFVPQYGQPGFPQPWSVPWDRQPQTEGWPQWNNPPPQANNPSWHGPYQHFANGGQEAHRPDEYRRDFGRQREAQAAPPSRGQRIPSPPVPYESQTPSLPARHPQRKQKTPRAQAVPSPTPSYLATSQLPVFTVVPSAANPPLLVLDLNHTLLHRASATTSASSSPIPRPFLSTFLAYVCKEWTPVVYSSARARNVLRMLQALALVPEDAVHPWKPREGYPLGLIWAREDMRLSQEEFWANVETVKDLEDVWTALGDRWGAERTVLLDDEAEKCQLQPYNHLPIAPFFHPPSSFPDGSSPSPAQTLPSDSDLLSTIALLHSLRTKSNVASFIRSGGLGTLRAVGSAELEREGRAICQELNIPVVEDWNSEWATWV